MPGSSESGAVPSTRVIVPPDFPVVVVPVDVEVEPLLLLGDVDELDDELPHALSTTTEAQARSTASKDRLCLCTNSSS
jgi:hypothetical protein